VWYDFNLLQLALSRDVGYSPEVDLFDVRASLRLLLAIVLTAPPGRGHADMRKDLGHTSRDLKPLDRRSKRTRKQIRDATSNEVNADYYSGFSEGISDGTTLYSLLFGTRQLMEYM
jgi:hypothetical protein